MAAIVFSGGGGGDGSSCLMAVCRAWSWSRRGRGHAVCRGPAVASSGLHALQTADDNQPNLCQRQKRLGVARLWLGPSKLTAG